jgi:hypothetical protein
MQTSDYFRWSADPSAFTIDPITFPFPVAISRLVLAVIAFFYGVNKLNKEAETKGQESETWKFWALGLGSLIGGQLLFLILPSPTFEQIGPIIAEKRHDARDLLITALTSCQDKSVIVDVFSENSNWLHTLKSLGFKVQRRLIRMYLGNLDHPGKPDKQFAIAGPELG